MKLHTYYLARANTGVFTGDTVSSSTPEGALASVPAGMVAVPEVADWRRSRWDAATQSLVPCEVQHDPERVRFELLGHYGRELASLESRKLRPMGVLLLNPDDSVERTRLAELEASLTQARAALARVKARELPLDEMLLLVQQLGIPM